MQSTGMLSAGDLPCTIPLWGIFLFIAPPMATNWPFGFLCFISLIVVSHAWVLLLIPRNWKMLGAYRLSFWLTITFLVVWLGGYVDRNWVDARQGFRIAAAANIAANWRLRIARCER